MSTRMSNSPSITRDWGDVRTRVGNCSRYRARVCRSNSTRLTSRVTGQLLSHYPTCPAHALIRHWKEQLKANLKAAQELPESGLVLSWGDEKGLFVAGAVYLKEAFGRKCGGIHFLAELKRDDGVLTAVDDQNGSVYFL